MIIHLKNRSLLRVSGPDAESFLQSQFSNDISKINEQNLQLNAYCQYQGKIIALIWVFKIDANFYLSLPKELKNSVLDKLNLYKMMSNLQIEDYSEDLYQYGVVDEKIDGMKNLINNLAIFISQKKLNHDDDHNSWELNCIKNELPEVTSKFSERYTPQLLNLDIDSLGVSFNKGCYPGQEVVARMHYLGKPKRRLFRFTSDFNVFIGDTLNILNSKSLKSSGEVIRVVNFNGKSDFLATFETRHICDSIYLNDNQNQIVNIIDE